MDFFSYYQSFDFDKVALAISGNKAWSQSMVPGRFQEALVREAFLQTQASKPSLSESQAVAKGRPIVKEAFTFLDVEAALGHIRREGAGVQLSMQEFQALLSPSADSYLEEMAQLARKITRQRFGKVMQIYAPLYLSNTCRSKCTYCGFSVERDIRRRTLTMQEIEQELDALKGQGLSHVLLLTGESYRDTPLGYLAQAVELAKKRMASVAIEVYPLKEEEYRGLRQVGLDGLAVYQETYDRRRYTEVHLQGMKKRMQFRLECPERAGRAGIRKIAIGALLGLSDPAADAFFTGLHARYLSHRFWQSQISVSLPRLRPAEGLLPSELPGISDRNYVRYLCAMRLFLPDAGLYLSTREPASMRDAMAGICITHMSAGSRTEPGGYTMPGSTEQFSIDDVRSVAEVESALKERNLEAVLVDWAPPLG